MSDTENPPPASPPTGMPPPRSGCLTAFMVLVGIVLLLPGLCAVIFGVTHGCNALSPIASPAMRVRMPSMLPSR